MGGKVASLKNRYSEAIPDNLKMAIIVSMLPKEYREVVLQSSAMMQEVGKVASLQVRDSVVSLATQKAALGRPSSTALDNVDKEKEVEGDCEWCGYGVFVASARAGSMHCRPKVNASTAEG